MLLYPFFKPASYWINFVTGIKENALAKSLEAPYQYTNRVALFSLFAFCNCIGSA